MEDVADISVIDRHPDGRHPLTDEGRESSFLLPAVLDLTQAQPLLDVLMAQAGDHPRRIDASAVERMSTPCAQILLAAGRAADLQDGVFQIVEASDVFCAALSDLGLKAEFKKWMN